MPSSTRARARITRARRLGRRTPGGTSKRARRAGGAESKDGLHERVERSCRHVGRGRLRQIRVHVRPEHHAHGPRPTRGEVCVEAHRNHRTALLRGVHELAAHVVRVVAAFGLGHVLARDKHEHHVGLVDASAHGVHEVAVHVRLVKPHVEESAGPKQVDHGAHASVRGAAHAPVVRGEDAHFLGVL